MSGWRRASRGCIICGCDNPIGLKAEFDRTEDGILARVTPGLNFQGFDGVLQGGIVAGLMDDAMWYAALAAGAVTMTAELTIRYKRPVPVETCLEVRGRVESKRRSLYMCAAEIRDQRGTVLAEAQGKFLEAPDEMKSAVELVSTDK